MHTLRVRNPTVQSFFQVFFPSCQSKAYRHKTRWKVACSLPFLWSKQLLPFLQGLAGLRPPRISASPWPSPTPQLICNVSWCWNTQVALEHSPKSSEFIPFFFEANFPHLIFIQIPSILQSPKYFSLIPSTRREFSFLNSQSFSLLRHLSLSAGTNIQLAHTRAGGTCWLLAPVWLGQCSFWSTLVVLHF